MKKEFKGFILGVLATTLVMGLGTCAVAIGNRQNIDVELNTVKVISNGNEINEDTLLWNDKTYIPLRATLEAAGCIVDWDPQTNTANVENSFFLPDPTYVTIDSKVVPAYRIAVLQNSDDFFTAYVNIPYLCDALGMSYDFDDSDGVSVLKLSSKAGQNASQFDQSYKNGLLSRVTKLIGYAKTSGKSWDQELSNIENGLASDYTAQEVQAEISQNDAILEELLKLYNDIQNTTSNNRLFSLEEEVYDYEYILK